MAKPKNFLRLLFDFSFSEFITPRILGILYAIGILITLVNIYYGVILGYASGGGVILILIALLTFFLSLIMIRVTLETLAAIFRIEKNIRIREDNKQEL